MNLRNKKIGIWGFGIVGQSAARFLLEHTNYIAIMDKKEPNLKQQKWLADNNITYTPEHNINLFLNQQDFILPSPGINISGYYQNYKNKWISELDLFAYYFKKPIIAITGSVGKTSVTTLLAGLLKNFETNFAVGGNIGTCSVNFIESQEKVDGALLEVSSFQLAYTKKFAPDLAIITNFSANHLDWHGNLDAYLQAKLQIFAHQKNTQKALIPYELLAADKKKKNLKKYALFCSQYFNIKSPEKKTDTNFIFHHTYPYFKDIVSSQKNTPFYYKNLYSNNTHIFSTNSFSAQELAILDPAYTLFFIQNNYIIKQHNNQTTSLYNISLLPPITCLQNWLIVIASLDILNLPLSSVHEYALQITLPAHRLEKIEGRNNITLYNDSKATTPAATINAVQTIQKNGPIHLFLGGLSKGIDREPLITALKNNVKKIYCFGAEAEQLADLCKKHALTYELCNTLEPAISSCFAQAKPGDQILFSPSGSSFDLFDNYEHRGDQFKQIIKRYL